MKCVAYITFCQFGMTFSVQYIYTGPTRLLDWTTGMAYLIISALKNACQFRQIHTEFINNIPAV